MKDKRAKLYPCKPSVLVRIDGTEVGICRSIGSTLTWGHPFRADVILDVNGDYWMPAGADYGGWNGDGNCFYTPVAAEDGAEEWRVWEVRRYHAVKEGIGFERVV